MCVLWWHRNNPKVLCPTECWSSAWGICRTGSPSPRTEPERPCVGVKQAKLGNMECCGVKMSVPRLEGTEYVVPNSAGGIGLMHLFCPWRSACWRCLKAGPLVPRLKKWMLTWRLGFPGLHVNYILKSLKMVAFSSLQGYLESPILQKWLDYSFVKRSVIKRFEKLSEGWESSAERDLCI